MKGLIIQGSARSDGNTQKITQILRESLELDLIDLSTRNIGQFRYDQTNLEDDFIPMIKHIVNEYDLIIFATPVYWYSMSGILKTFFDRITELLRGEKAIGRKLRGKYMGAISCGSDSTEVDGFFVPFQRSAEYLGMGYLGDLHTWVDSEYPDKVVTDLVKQFALKIKEQLG